MVRRDAKEIASMKTANLVEQTRLLLRDLNEAKQPEDKAGIVANIRKIDDEAKELGDAASLLRVEQEQRLQRLSFPFSWPKTDLSALSRRP